MKVSLHWAQHVSNVDLTSIPKDELLKKIGAQLGAVEEVAEWGPRYDGIVIAKIVSCEPHPNADKLHVCRLDDGKVVKDVERGQDGCVQVVCGAPNVRSGMFAVWLPPGVTVPSTIDKDPFVLGARELRGVLSNGMMASPAELGLSDDHSGILEVVPEDVGLDLCKPGAPFKKLYGMDDFVIDCENKMFTHRPDCFGILGVARELAGITGQAFKSPQWYLDEPMFKPASGLDIAVKVQTNLVPRFMAVALQGCTIQPSPVYMQAGLTRVGIRPINNVVDITNWMMHLTAQPTHAYDYDKVKALCDGPVTLVARLSKKGEILQLLNGKQIVLDDSTMVIATDKHVIGLAGVMGGADTEVDQNTQNIILEAASFDMYAIRRASMKYGIFTDAVTRFNKGQSPLQNDRVVAEAMRLLSQLVGSTQASDVQDYKDATVLPMVPVQVSTRFINERLGSDLSATETLALLANVECGETINTPQAIESRSYIMGVGDITAKLERIGVVVHQKTDDGHYMVTIPSGKETEYEKLIATEIQPGFWNEYIGVQNVFLFKALDTKVTRYEVNDDTEHEIVETCRLFNNEFYSSVETMLALNDWYRPLLPLRKKATQSEQAEQADREPDMITVAPPFWRRDLELPEDIVEEVGRLYGFDKLPVTLPRRSTQAAAKNSRLELKAKTRSSLARGGANELLTYSFVHENLLKKAGQDPTDAYHLRNAISPELQYYRLSLTPSLLDKVHANVKAGTDKFAVFEIGKSHAKSAGIDDENVPVETELVSLVVAAKQGSAGMRGAAYYAARAYAEHLVASLGIQVDFRPILDAPESAIVAPYNASRSAFVYVKGTDSIIGIVGEFTKQVRSGFKLPDYCAGFELGLDEIVQSHSARLAYRQVAKFPKVRQDATYQVADSVTYGTVIQLIENAVAQESTQHGYVITIEPGDIYQPDADEVKRITLHYSVHHPDRTLTSQEVTAALERIGQQLTGELAATIV